MSLSRRAVSLVEMVSNIAQRKRPESEPVRFR